VATWFWRAVNCAATFERWTDNDFRLVAELWAPTIFSGSCAHLCHALVATSCSPAVMRFHAVPTHLDFVCWTSGAAELAGGLATAYITASWAGLSEGRSFITTFCASWRCLGLGRCCSHAFLLRLAPLPSATTYPLNMSLCSHMVMLANMNAGRTAWRVERFAGPGAERFPPAALRHS